MKRIKSMITRKMRFSTRGDRPDWPAALPAWSGAIFNRVDDEPGTTQRHSRHPPYPPSEGGVF